MQWWIRLMAGVAMALTATAAGPEDFGLAEYDAAVAAYNQTHKVKINKPKIMAELNLEAPETFRVEPYTVGGAHITGGDLRGLMYGLLEAADQLRNAGRMKRAHGIPDLPLRGVRIRADVQSPWFSSADFWRGYFADLARNRFNRAQIVFEEVPDRAGLALIGMISQTAAQFGVDAGIGVRMATPALLERLLTECPAVRFVTLRSMPSALDMRAFFQVLREIGRRVVLELPSSTGGTDASGLLQLAGQGGMPVRLYSQYGAAPSSRPADFYLQLEADQLGTDPDSVSALLMTLGCGIEIASPSDSAGRPDLHAIGIWGRLAYGQNK